LKADIILADPPWNFATYSDKGKDRSADNHYATCTLNQMKQFPVSEIASKDCLLFMWVVDPMLPEALDLGRAWGFEYKTVGFYWAKAAKSDPNKDSIGLGYYTRSSPEQCWIFRRIGSKKGLSRANKGVRRLYREPDAEAFDFDKFVRTPVQGHSVKPEEVQRRIERLFGDVVESLDGSTRPLERVELFARRNRSGWTCAGNEIDGMDHADSIPMIANDTYIQMRDAV